MSTDARRRWYEKQASRFGPILGWHKGMVELSADEAARVAAHFGRLALGETKVKPGYDGRVENIGGVCVYVPNPVRLRRLSHDRAGGIPTTGIGVAWKIR